jgi:ABC-type bacteriocin/lantibiotic exporter with double-glycine peptidase domain
MILRGSEIRPMVTLISEFLGSRVMVLMAASIVLGLLVFSVELLMAFSIQSFFLALGLMDSNQNPHWLSKLLGVGNSLNEALLLLLVVGTLRGLFSWLQNYASSLTTVEFETLNRNRLTAWAFGERSAQVAYVASLFNDKTVGAGNFVSSIMAGVSRVIVALLLTVTLLRQAPEVTVVSFVLLSVLYLPFRFLSIRIRTASDSIHAELDSSMSRLLRGVRNILLLHIYGLHKREQQLTEKHLTGYLTDYRSYHLLSGVKNMLPQVVGIWLVCLITITANSQGTLQGAQIIEYFYLFIRFVQSIGELANLGSYVSLTRPRLLAVWDWWCIAREQKDEWVSTDFNAAPFAKPVGWIIRSLSYCYPGSDTTVINKLELTIQPGSTLVITGASGSGKSTLLALMLGLFRPSDGKVELLANDAIISLADGRSHLLAGMGYVGPESFIIPGTIRENLLYGTSIRHADEELHSALALSDCGFVYNMRNGLDHVLTEQGEGLSAGQKQRLALARALLRNPNVLILDEATANLDAETERALVDTLAQLKGTITIVAVTHREALLRIADQRLILSSEFRAD